MLFLSISIGSRAPSQYPKRRLFGYWDGVQVIACIKTVAYVLWMIYLFICYGRTIWFWYLTVRRAFRISLMAFSHSVKKTLIVNELKTKLIAFGCKDNIRVLFNGQQIGITSQYKYLGNIINTTQTSRGDVFRDNYEYLCSQARKAIFGLPPRALMHMYETLILPVLVYGGDVWGSQHQGTLAVD